MDTFRGALLAASLLIATGAMPTAAIATGPGASHVTLAWSAPGDDGFVGVASRYDLRYSLKPITTDNFGQARPATNVAAPAAAGLRERAKVAGLEANRLYYFALKTADDAGNWSALSNVAFKTAPDPATLARSSELSLAAPYPSPARNGIRLDFTLPVEMFAHIKVFDVGGREVKTLAYDYYDAGTTTLRWNLNTEEGVRLRVGQYWIKALLGDRTLTQRLTVAP